MRAYLTLLLILCGGWFCTAIAEDVVLPPQDIRGFCTRTTIIDVVRLPDLTRKDLPPTVELAITEWRNGVFVDAAGRSWCLSRGLPVRGTPDKLVGWVIKSVHGKEFFYTATGSLYGISLCHRPAAKLPAPLEKKNGPPVVPG